MFTISRNSLFRGSLYRGFSVSKFNASIIDARRLCRITGKRMDGHNYLPLLELGKRPECVRCTITGKNNNNVHENKSTNNNQFVHSVRNDFKYVTPILRKEAMEAGMKLILRNFLHILHISRNYN